MRTAAASFTICLLLSLTAVHAAEEEAPAPESPDYLLPDLPLAAAIHDGERAWIKPIIAIVGDYTWIDQDDASLEQVGEQEDTHDLRALRVGFTLRSKSKRAWDVFFAVEGKERKTREDVLLELFDLRLGIPLGPVKLDIGKQKQPFVFEMVGLSIQNPQQERILSPFFVTRSIGVRLGGNPAGGRMTWAAGWYNDWLDSDLSFSDNGDDYVGRLTGLVATSPDDLEYLHLGLAYRRVGADDGVMRFSGRPESNVTDKYLDTGEFLADHADQLALEAAWSLGPVALMSEHVEARVESPETGDPEFSGSYLLGSWILTGESRPYDRPAGHVKGIVPKRRFGAFELMARYSRVDLTDGSIDGGEIEKWLFGFNWWVSTQWKAGISYGDADLDKDGLRGNTKLVLLRLQWLF